MGRKKGEEEWEKIYIFLSERIIKMKRVEWTVS